MREVPILFSTPMVQAILNGRKTQTRRIVKPQPIDSIEVDGNLFEGNHKGYVKVDGHPAWPLQFAYEFARWKPGDRLWVRETWNQVWECKSGKLKGQRFCKGDHFPQNHSYSAPWFEYAAGPFTHDEEPPKWKPSIHMPRAAARIWLEVEEVRVERLQSIGEEDAWNEGIEPDPTGCSETQDGEVVWYFKNYAKTGYRYIPAIDSYRSLWEAINGPESWNQNPFVWVIKFRKL